MKTIITLATIAVITMAIAASPTATATEAEDTATSATLPFFPHTKQVAGTDLQHIATQKEGNINIGCAIAELADYRNLYPLQVAASEHPQRTAAYWDGFFAQHCPSLLSRQGKLLASTSHGTATLIRQVRIACGNGETTIIADTLDDYTASLAVCEPPPPPSLPDISECHSGGAHSSRYYIYRCYIILEHVGYIMECQHVDSTRWNGDKTKIRLHKQLFPTFADTINYAAMFARFQAEAEDDCPSS